MSSFFRQQLEGWLGGLEIKADSVLDAGGASNPVSGRVKKWNVKNCKVLDCGCETAKVKIDIEADLNEQINCQFDEHYDIVFCLEVMEYIWNPKQALENLYNFLKVDGILYLSVPFIYPHHNPTELDYLRYTRWGIKKLLNEAGFMNIEITARIEKGGLKIFDWFTAEKMHPAKTYGGHDEIGYLIKAIK